MHAIEYMYNMYNLKSGLTHTYVHMYVPKKVDWR